VQKRWNFNLPPDVSVLIIRHYKEVLKHKIKTGKALRKHNLHGEKAVSVLLILFISDNKRCHTTYAP